MNSLTFSFGNGAAVTGITGTIRYRLGHMGLPGYLHVLFLLLFAAIVITPLAPLVLSTVMLVITDPHKAIELATPSGRILGLLGNSVVFALTVSAAATILGALAGTWLWYNPGGPKAYIPWVLMIFLPLPSTLYFFAWTSLFPISGWVGAWWVQVMMYLPLLSIFSFLGLSLVEQEKIEAGRIFAPELRVYRHIVLPLAAPLILAGTGFVFIFCLLDYTVPSLCSVNVYALEIFAQYSATNNPAAACLLALPLVIIAGAAVFFSQNNLKRAFQKISRGGKPRSNSPTLPGWFIRVQQVAIAVTLLGAVFLLVNLVGSAITGQTVGMTQAVYGDIVFSFTTALLAGLLCLAPALAVAKEMSGGRGWSGLWWVITLVPLAIPAALAGIGIISISNTPALEPVTGGIVLPVLVNLFRFVPVAAIILTAQLRLTDRSLLEAGEIFSTGILHEWWKIRLPLFYPGILMAAYLVFAFSLGELGGAIMVIPPGSSTLTLRLYNYLHYGASGSVAQLSLVLAGIVLLSGIVFLLAIKAIRRYHAHQHANIWRRDH